MDNQNEKRNANVQQDRQAKIKDAHAQFNNMGLTKRNAEYMYRFTVALNRTKLSNDDKASTISQMLDELKAGQKQGKTARNMWGSVDEKVENIVNPPKKEGTLSSEYWPNAIYNMFLFFMIFTLLYGITYFVSPKSGKESMMGITGIILSAGIAGLGMPVISQLFDPKIKHKQSGWQRVLIMVGFFLVWMIVFFAAGIMPRAINPILNPIVYLVLGGASIGVVLYLKRRYNIRGGLF